MNDLVIAPPPQPTLPVSGSSRRFPVHRIYCVGRNYAAHAVEMGYDPAREPPFFFQKNPDCIITDGTFPYPAQSADVHHEIELVVALGEGGDNISEAQALDRVWGYAVGLDMTRRDLQAEAKKEGRPWEIAKAFEASAPMSALSPAAEIGHPQSGAITLSINGSRRQDGDLNQMIWKTAEIIACLSRYFSLRPGDLIMTGTPAGVGPVVAGDQLEGRIDGVGALHVAVV